MCSLSLTLFCSFVSSGECIRTTFRRQLLFILYIQFTGKHLIDFPMSSIRTATSVISHYSSRFTVGFTIQHSVFPIALKHMIYNRLIGSQTAKTRAQLHFVYVSVADESWKNDDAYLLWTNCRFIECTVDNISKSEKKRERTFTAGVVTAIVILLWVAMQFSIFPEHLQCCGHYRLSWVKHMMAIQCFSSSR